MSNTLPHLGRARVALAAALTLGVVASAQAQQRVNLDVKTQQDSFVSPRVNLRAHSDPANLSLQPRRFSNLGTGLSGGGQFNSLRRQMDLARLGPTRINDTRYAATGSSVSAYSVGSPYRITAPYQVTLPAHLDPKSYSAPTVPMSPYRDLKSLSPYAGL